MEIELISKKALLKQTNISYGQLYRWKRKNLIPENWFIKKSVSTGQETFFPKAEILERIEMIIALKDEVSLDELAARFNKSPVVVDHVMDFDEEVIALYERLTGSGLDQQNRVALLMAHVLQHYVLTGEITFDEGKLVHQFLQQQPLVEERLFLIRHLGTSLVLATTGNLLLSSKSKCVLEIDIKKGG